MHVRRRSIGVSGYGLRILAEEYENSFRILTDSSFKIFLHICHTRRNSCCLAVSSPRSVLHALIGWETANQRLDILMDGHR